ncbi:MAG: hypothetical protein KAR45_21725 [Desulfobacteraceae bacterium]|nr:hypothetical protein [Desulfobacteraceae bacterium]
MTLQHEKAQIKIVSGTCVSSEGQFVYGVHKPHFDISNLREKDFITAIGSLPDGVSIFNKVNFPLNDIKEKNADIIYEIPNPFPFRGTTYINSAWADYNSHHHENIKIEEQKPFSFQKSIKTWLNQSSLSKDQINKEQINDLFSKLPRPVLIAIAESSTDPDELIALAKTVCTFVFDEDSKTPKGLYFKKTEHIKTVPDIKDHVLFEIIANNIHLPDVYKNAMVLVPGIQGTSEITGDKHDKEDGSHVYEYLRKNSYVPWGHFAANMANNSVRYSAEKLLPSDMEGMRHLYYQRTYIRLAEQLDILVPQSIPKKALSTDNLENLRSEIIEKLSNNNQKLKFDRSLWGWNYGFGFSHSGYNLHASHQQIHQQFAMIPKHVQNIDNAGVVSSIPSYACGDLIEDFVKKYRKETGRSFFNNYLDAITSNIRTDGDPTKEASLKVFEDENVILFVPKAQISQFELQLMPKKQCGNVLEADSAMRNSIDKAILISIQTLESLGAKMVSTIEFSKRFDLDENHDQNILYSFLPKTPMSPGAFSEAQLRWINGHYPEDFALACRLAIKKSS